MPHNRKKKLSLKTLFSNKSKLTEKTYDLYARSASLSKSMTMTSLSSIFRGSLHTLSPSQSLKNDPFLQMESSFSTINEKSRFEDYRYSKPLPRPPSMTSLNRQSRQENHAHAFAGLDRNQYQNQQDYIDAVALKLHEYSAGPQLNTHSHSPQHGHTASREEFMPAAYRVPLPKGLIKRTSFRRFKWSSVSRPAESSNASCASSIHDDYSTSLAAYDKKVRENFMGEDVQPDIEVKEVMEVNSIFSGSSSVGLGKVESGNFLLASNMVAYEYAS